MSRPCALSAANQHETVTVTILGGSTTCQHGADAQHSCPSVAFGLGKANQPSWPRTIKQSSKCCMELVGTVFLTDASGCIAAAG